MSPSVCATRLYTHESRLESSLTVAIARRANSLYLQDAGRRVGTLLNAEERCYPELTVATIKTGT